MSYKEKIQNEIKKILNGSGDLIPLERTKQRDHGDVASNIAMVLAKKQKKNPFEIANEIKSKINTSPDLISKIEIAKPGFINFFISDSALIESLYELLKEKETYGFQEPKSKEKILIEYVSANPTGDLHLGHGRQAALGSCLANLLNAAGYDVSTEFYINDYGEQISKLNETSWAIYKKLSGETIEWKEEYYPEDGIAPYVKRVIETGSKNYTEQNLGNEVKDLILKEQKDLLSSFNIIFDKWFSETELHKSKSVIRTLEKLKETGQTYEQDGAIWFKAKEFGDVRDRVLVRSDGRSTYLLADIAYHIDKLSRGFNTLINIWGADHHGQEVSLKGGLKALGYEDEKLEIIFVQLVSLKKDGQEVKMSKRAGTVVSVAEVLEEVGSDAFRYFLSETSPNNRMVFDISLALKQDKDNPVYYIQYAHARCCSIFRQSEEVNIKPDLSIDSLLKLLTVNEKEYIATKDLLLRIFDFPEEVDSAAKNKSSNKIGNYLKDLASDFHQFYTICRVISTDKDLTKARLALVEATRITIANGLEILGVNAPTSM